MKNHKISPSLSGGREDVEVEVVVEGEGALERGTGQVQVTLLQFHGGGGALQLGRLHGSSGLRILRNMKIFYFESCIFCNSLIAKF